MNTNRIGDLKVKEYKVMTQKDKLFSGKFDPVKLENALNNHAKEGWRVAGITSAEFPSLIRPKDEMVIILERDV